MKRFMKHLFMLCLFGIISIGASAANIPNNEIWYTSNDGKIVTPFQRNVFGASIVSNTYTNGKGIIKFDGNVTSIGEYAFYYCSGLTSVTIPNSVTKIGESAFYCCSGLTSVTIPNSVTKIGNSAFSGCSGLTSVAIPYSVTSIGECAFNGCKGLTSVTIPNSVTAIGEGAFSGCSGLTSVTIPNSVTWIDECAFNGCKGLTSVRIPNSVTKIGERAFSGCPGLTSMVVESGNTKYDSRSNCNAIIETARNTLISGCKNTTIPNSVTSIGDYAFNGCKGLTSVRIPNSVTKIGESAFYNCSGLTSVKIPNSVTKIGEDAFRYCSDLTSVYAGWKDAEKIPSLYSEDFPYSTCDLYVPAGTKEIYHSKDYWKTFRNIIESTTNIKITNTDGTDGSIFAEEGDDVALNDNIKSIEITEKISNVNITYTRNFDKAGVWQAWYMPFNVAYDDMKNAYDVAQIHGVLLDKDKNAVLAFLKLDEGMVKANTPYVVRPKVSGDVAITATTDLQPTQSNSFLMMSATDKYTIGGVYEQTTTTGNWYALNLDGQFQLMGSGVYLRPFRIYMTINPREDNPYATSANANAKMDIVVLGDDEPTGIGSLTPALSQGEGAIYNLNGQRVTSITSGHIYIMNGKKYIAK